jgi:acetyl esterase/lipase
MARMDLRVRAWGWLTRRQASVVRMTESQVVAMQQRHMPENMLTGWLLGATAPGTVVTNQAIKGPDANDIPIRLYRPASVAGIRPLIVYFHGGGFVFGDLRMGDWLCSSVAARVGAVVVSVDYRLAPAHRFPAPLEDCYTAFTWAVANAAELGATGAVGVMGESAGGNLSAVVAMLARDRGGPKVSHQALLYPATDMRDSATRTASAVANGNAPFLSPDEMTAYRKLYVGPDIDLTDPKVSPLLAASHDDLPPALIQVAEYDPLHDDGMSYAAALRAAGVPVRLTEYVGMPHGFLNMPGLCRAAPQALAELCAEQSAALA